MIKRPKILLIEDNPISVQITTTALREKGFEVDVVEDALTAVSLISIRDYDCAIVDYELPIFKGSSVEGILKRRGIPAFYYTGYHADEIENPSLPVVSKDSNIGNLFSMIFRLLQHCDIKELQHA